MPIEIRELVIKTKIIDDDHFRNGADADSIDLQVEKNIIDKCVQEVIKKLKKKIDR